MSVMFVMICSLSYAQQKPPIKDVCLYPEYTGDAFDFEWTHDEPGEWLYTVSAVHYVTDEVITFPQTSLKTVTITINKSGLWELRVTVNGNTLLPFSSTLNTDTCVVDGEPQKWVVYTSPAPPGDPIFD